MKRIRILEVNKAYYPHVGGIETLVKQYSEELKQHGAIVNTLVCRDGRGGTYTDNVNGVNVVFSGSLGTYFSCPLSLSFIAKFRKMSKNVNVVHMNAPFPLADLALLLSGYKGKVIVSWHSDIVKQKKLLFLYRPLMKYMLNRADIILTATRGHIDGSDILPKYRKKCKILPYGIEPEKYLNIEKKPVLTELMNDKNRVKVFFTGRLVYYKGVDVLLKAFTKVKNCELFIAGTGELESSLKKYAIENGIADNAHFLGFLPDDTLKQAFADCDIFVLPSVARSEAFGIVQLEAMIYGKPVINTDLPSGVPYVSIHGKTGLTVRPSDERMLANAIQLLADDSKLRKRLGDNAQKRVKENFNEKDVINKLYTIMQRL